jgi:hypothetical protein
MQDGTVDQIGTMIETHGQRRWGCALSNDEIALEELTQALVEVVKKRVLSVGR